MGGERVKHGCGDGDYIFVNALFAVDLKENEKDKGKGPVSTQLKHPVLSRPPEWGSSTLYSAAAIPTVLILHHV